MYRRFIVLLTGLVCLAGLAGPASAQGPIGPQHTDPTWQAWYWNNTSLAGPPALQRNETELQHNWGSGSPDPAIRSDGFSARWTRYVDVPPGSYRLAATSDDGIRVWIDGRLLIDEWYDHGATTFHANVDLGSGHHLVVVEYYESQGEALVNVSLGAGPMPVYNWRGEYFNNTGLDGAPALVRDDAEINFDWGYGSPVPGPLGVDRFSVRWTRSLNLPPGTYRFRMTVDDGGRLWVNNHLLIDAWRVQAATTYTGEIYLPGGDIQLKMEYFEQDGGAVARLSWAGGGAPQPPSPPPPPVYGWRGEYFPNRSLAESPALVRDDRDINFDWGRGAPAPGFPADDFSVRWTRQVNLPGGTYNFYAQHDDGVRLWVDDRLVIDAWYDQAATVHRGTISLNAGLHHVRVEYYEHLDQASIAVWWESGGPQPPPAPPPDPVGEVVVDNTGRGFVWGGPVRNRFSAPVGVGGQSYWTYNSTSYPVNYGKWVPRLPAAGNYEVLVYIPRDYSSSTNVRYRVLHHGQRHDRIISQNRYHDQWVSLGTYYFNARNTGYESVLVYDNTREPYTSRTIAFDAIKFVRR